MRDDSGDCSFFGPRRARGSWSPVSGIDPRRGSAGSGGEDHPGIHSIAVDPRDGGTSRGGFVRRRVDSRPTGRTWTLGAKGMRAEYMPPEDA